MTTVRRRLVSALAAVGLLTAGGLALVAGPARAAATASAQLTPVLAVPAVPAGRPVLAR